MALHDLIKLRYKLVMDRKGFQPKLKVSNEKSSYQNWTQLFANLVTCITAPKHWIVYAFEVEQLHIL